MSCLLDDNEFQIAIWLELYRIVQWFKKYSMNRKSIAIIVQIVSRFGLKKQKY